MVPTTDDFLAGLRQRREEGMRLRDEAAAKGDKRLARTYQLMVSQVEKMIAQKGGANDA